MEKILFLSDLHICPLGETIISLDPLARMERALNAALTAHSDAAALILLGDLTHHGDIASYRRLSDALRNCAVPVIAMLGNHDRRDAFVQAFPDAPQMPSGHIQAVRDIGRHRIITLDSLDGPPYEDGHHAGRLCAQRLAFLETALATRDGRHAIGFVENAESLFSGGHEGSSPFFSQCALMQRASSRRRRFSRA